MTFKFLKGQSILSSNDHDGYLLTKFSIVNNVHRTVHWYSSWSSVLLTERKIRHHTRWNSCLLWVVETVHRVTYIHPINLLVDDYLFHFVTNVQRNLNVCSIFYILLWFNYLFDILFSLSPTCCCEMEFFNNKCYIDSHANNVCTENVVVTDSYSF